MNRRLFVLVFVLVALVGLWLYGGREQTAPPPEIVDIAAKCNVADCGHEFAVKLPSGFDRSEEFPRACAKCGQQTAYQMVVCQGCNAHYPNDEVRLHPVNCAKCGTALPGE